MSPGDRLAGPWARELLSRPLRQPDHRSCGAAVLVVAEALRNERFARRLVAGGPARFADEVLGMHSRSTGAVDVAGRVQPPWPRPVGTPPWAVARHLTARTGVPHRVRPVWPWRRRRALAAAGAAVRAGCPVPLYLGSRLLPRHVVLVVDAGPRGSDLSGAWAAYDPAPGRVRPLHPDALLAGEARNGWPVPWFVVVPEPPTTPTPGRRTRA